MIKILFAALQYDYGREKNGLSVEYTNFYDAMRHMAGVEVEFFPIDIHTQKLGRDGANELLLQTVKRQQPDVMFCYLLSEEIKRDVVAEITRTAKTKTFNWFADDHWRLPIFSRYWAPLFTLVSTTDPNAPEWYKKYGITNVIRSQWGANQHLYFPQNPANNPGDLDITFVGKKFGRRGHYIQTLMDHQLPVKAFGGGGWELGRVSQEKMIEIFSYSKINLNFSETHYAGLTSYVKLFAKLFVTKVGGKYRFVGHHLPDNIRSALGTRHLCIKGRVFEVAACGGFVMTGKTDDDISEYYVPGQEVVVFESLSDMVDKCRYYLEHGAERDKIAKAGYARTLRDHTYEQRFRAIFKALGYNL